MRSSIRLLFQHPAVIVAFAFMTAASVLTTVTSALTTADFALTIIAFPITRLAAATTIPFSAP